MKIWLLTTTTSDTECWAEGPDAQSWAHHTREGAIQHLWEWVEELTDDHREADAARDTVTRDGWVEVEIGHLFFTVSIRHAEIGA